MNVISRIPSEPSIARGDYVFDSDHMFFSDYSKRLAESIDEINWTEVLLLSKELVLAVQIGPVSGAHCQAHLPTGSHYGLAALGSPGRRTP